MHQFRLSSAQPCLQSWLTWFTVFLHNFWLCLKFAAGSVPRTVPGRWRLVPPLFFFSTNNCLTSKSLLLLHWHTHGLYPLVSPHAALWLMCGGLQLDLIWQCLRKLFMQYKIIRSSWMFQSNNIWSESSRQNRNKISLFCLQFVLLSEITWKTTYVSLLYFFLTALNNFFHTVVFFKWSIRKFHWVFMKYV